MTSQNTLIELAVQMVIMDAMETGHVNKATLIEYMKSETFEKSVANYVAMFKTL